MSLLALIIVASGLGSLVSLAGGVLLLWRAELSKKIGVGMVAFAAGVLLGVAFLDLLPEAIKLCTLVVSESNQCGVAVEQLLAATLAGITLFFFTERFVVWFHGHHHRKQQKALVAPLLITLGDSLHNFIDGVTIASAFLAGILVGVITSISVELHEIPQEIGDFTILLSRGLKPATVLRLNLLSALTSVLGAVIAFYLLSAFEQYVPVFLAFAAGNFIYIASADLIPEIHHHQKGRRGAYRQSLLLLVGIAVIYLATR